MIYQKGKYWKIRGNLNLYNSREEAELAGMKKDEPAPIFIPQKESIIEPFENSPFENMIEKNICNTCNLEPCECSHYTSKTDLGESSD